MGAFVTEVFRSHQALHAAREIAFTMTLHPSMPLHRSTAIAPAS
jgi:hypothetical protein